MTGKNWKQHSTRIRDKVKVKVEVKENEGTGGLAFLPIEPATRNPQPTTALISSFIRPFDLAEAPLLRVGLIKEDETRNILLMDMHHIISDGISMGIIAKDLMALYGDRELSSLRIRYKDYSQWQNQVNPGEKEKETLTRQETYWLKQFEDEVPVLNLLLDDVRPSEQNFEGRCLGFELGIEETRALKILANREKTTIYMVLLAIFNVFLSKLSDQEDIVIPDKPEEECV